MLKILQPTRQGENVAAKSAASGSGLSFRLASSISDLPAIVQLAHEAHDESRFGYIPLTQIRFVRSQRQLSKIKSAMLS